MRTLLDLLLPASCLSCGAPGNVACQMCTVALQSRAVLSWPEPSPAGLPPPYAVAAYDGPTRSLLLAYKERGAVGLRPVFGDALATSVAAAIAAASCADGVALVPAPSAPLARRRRGEDVVMTLARHAAHRVRIAGHRTRVVAALVHTRTVRDSAGLTATERAGNLAGAIRVRSGGVAAIGGSPVVLVDDIVTTGATLAESARALCAVGTDVVAAATIAATRRTPA